MFNFLKILTSSLNLKTKLSLGHTNTTGNKHVKLFLKLRQTEDAS